MNIGYKSNFENLKNVDSIENLKIFYYVDEDIDLSQFHKLKKLSIRIMRKITIILPNSLKRLTISGYDSTPNKLILINYEKLESLTLKYCNIDINLNNLLNLKKINLISSYFYDKYLNLELIKLKNFTNKFSNLEVLNLEKCKNIIKLELIEENLEKILLPKSDSLKELILDINTQFEIYNIYYSSNLKNLCLMSIEQDINYNNFIDLEYLQIEYYYSKDKYLSFDINNLNNLKEVVLRHNKINYIDLPHI